MSDLTVNVPSLGTLLKSFSASFDEINFSQEEDTNNCAEASVTMQCSQEPWNAIDDTLRICGNATSSGYNLSVDFDSEVGNLLFGDGSVNFSYADGSGWTLSARADGSTYNFFDASLAFDMIMDSLQCFIDSDKGSEAEDATLELLSASLIANKAAMIENVPTYSGGNCAALESEPLEIGDVVKALGKISPDSSDAFDGDW